MGQVQGNINGIKDVYLAEMEELYNFTIPKDQIITREVAEGLVSWTGKINREIAIYISRKGKVLEVSIGDSKTVNLPNISTRRSSTRLNGVRCIHTHPGGSGKLSDVDISAMFQLKLDMMVAIGVKENKIVDTYIGIITPINPNKIACREIGPLSIEGLTEINCLALINESEKILDNYFSTTVERDEERAVLVGISYNKEHPMIAEKNLDELSQLSQSAKVTVLQTVIQRKDRPDPSTYLGKGKIKEIALLMQTLDANLLICDDELSPSQHRNLELLLGTKVVDRTGLILDIFAQRAQSREGKIQVELAQLQYILPRLIGQRTSLSRLGGGIGTRGPGETKLETDRRKIRSRISELEKVLAEITNQRSLHRKIRKERQVPIVALVGYTNAGKSTLTNYLTNRFGTKDKSVFSADLLFATLDPSFRKITIDGREIIIVDTVGFINKLPHHLIKAFRATLEEVLEADILLHVVDGASKTREKEAQVVLEVLKELKALDRPLITVMNKLDLMENNQEAPITIGNEVAVSAQTGQGMGELILEIKNTLPNKRILAKFLIPYSEAKLVNYLHNVGKVAVEKYDVNGIILHVDISNEDYNRFREYSFQEDIDEA